MLDNLIHEKRIPPIVAVFLPPGPGGQRTIEYDTVSDRYVNFVESEVLPRITRDQGGIHDGSRGTGNVRREFRRGGGADDGLAAPEPVSTGDQLLGDVRGASAQRDRTEWGVDFHQTFIPTSARKPLRIWLHVSENDLGAASPLNRCATGWPRTTAWPLC